MNKLKELLTMNFNYDMAYDFDDMKLAIVCKDFIVDGIELDSIDYEDIIALATWVRVNWNKEFNNLSYEEQGYIQEYARRILNENIDKIEKLLRSDYEQN